MHLFFLLPPQAPNPAPLELERPCLQCARTSETAPTASQRPGPRMPICASPLAYSHSSSTRPLTPGVLSRLPNNAMAQQNTKASYGPCDARRNAIPYCVHTRTRKRHCDCTFVRVLRIARVQGFGPEGLGESHTHRKPWGLGVTTCG